VLHMSSDTILRLLPRVHVALYAELTFLTPYVSISRRNSVSSDA